MHDIDISVFHLLHDNAGRWPALDGIVNMLADNPLIKAGPVLLAVWFLWFVRDPETNARRARLVSMLLGGCAAAGFSVWLTRVLPLRARPIFEPSLRLEFAEPHVAEEWTRVSSLPSDHAALFVGLAVGLIFVSRRWGWPILLHAVLFVCLPRAYLGLHYFWDLVAGASIGLAFALLCNTDYFRTRISEPLLRLEVSHAPSFYGAMFILTFQISDLFHSSRQVLGYLGHAGKWIVRGARIASGN